MKTITTLSFHALGLAGLMALTALCPPVHAATSADSSSSTLKRADRRFIEKAAKSDDPDIAAFAQKTLPTLQHHLDLAKARQAAQSQ